MAIDHTSSAATGPRSIQSSAVAEPAASVNDALSRLIEAQNALASSLEVEHEETHSLDEIDVLLTEARATADHIVERAELEALTIRRLMRIEAERLLESVERLKERAQRIEHKLT
jgi:hypothetical protein